MVPETEALEKKPHSFVARLRIARIARKMAAHPSNTPPSGLTGALPTEGRSDVVLLAACDSSYYWRHVITLILSVERNGAPQRMHVHLCGPDGETVEHVERLVGQLRHVHLTWTADSAELATGLASPEIYFAAARYLMIPLVLNAAKAPVLCIAANAIAMKPVSSAFETIRSKCDVALFRYKAGLGTKIFPGAIGVNPSTGGVLFAKALAGTLEKGFANGPTHHFDQIALRYLVAAIERKRSDVSFTAMPLGLMDFQFNENSVLWTPRGQGGKSLEPYHKARLAVTQLFPEVPRQPRPASLTTDSSTNTPSPPPKMGPRLTRLTERHGRWLDDLGIRTKPWLILGSAPDPTLPPDIVATHARVDINNAGRTATDMGLGRADLTVRARRKSWEEHRNIDTRGLIWLHSQPPFMLRLLLLNKPYDHIGKLIELTRPDRDAIVTRVSGASVKSIGDLGKVTNGVAAACYGLFLGVPQIVLAGISLSKAGHSYDELGRRRRQVDEDAFILDRLKNDPRVFTTEEDLARDAGLKLIG